jgi:hypothetical protein
MQLKKMRPFIYLKSLLPENAPKKGKKPAF